jgi:hypothetical protein
MVTPKWTVHVVDYESGKPVEGITVLEVSREYSIEQKDQVLDKVTGKDGTVTFPARFLYVSILRRIAGAALSIAREGAHASFGSDAYVDAGGKGLEEDRTNEWLGFARRMNSEIVLHTCSVRGTCN